jgi:hypothetical protein
VLKSIIKALLYIPSKLKADKKAIKDLKNSLCLDQEFAIFENVVLVGPGSLNAQPPTATYTWSPGSDFLRATIF